MKFEQKLINLRKQKSMSQEEFAEKLGVTRQTVSKWELGQTRSEMDKLIEISKLCNVSVEELTSDAVDIGKEKEKVKPVKRERKYILYILIVILIAASATLAVRLGLAREENKKQQEGLFNNIFGTVTDAIGNQMQDNNDNINDMIDGIKDIYNGIEQEQENKKDSPGIFNSGLTYAEGTQATIFVEGFLDTIVTKNKLNKDMLITVVYKGKSTTDVEEIKKIKKSLKEWSEYEVSLDYDEDGYIIKLTIEE